INVGLISPRPRAASDCRTGFLCFRTTGSAAIPSAGAVIRTDHARDMPSGTGAYCSHSFDSRGTFPLVPSFLHHAPICGLKSSVISDILIERTFNIMGEISLISDN
ncbi:hypothetical protein, partial [Phyllobacterium sp. P5_D12]